MPLPSAHRYGPNGRRYLHGPNSARSGASAELPISAENQPDPGI